MSILTGYKEHPFNEWIFQKKHCFYCGQPLTFPCVHWMGCSPDNSNEPGDILLHPGCVVELSIRLFRDVHEIEVTSHEYVSRYEPTQDPPRKAPLPLKRY